MNPSRSHPAPVIRRLAPAVAAFGILTGLALTPSRAVVFEFTATVDYLFGDASLLPPGIALDTPLTGTVQFDPARAGFDGNPGNPNIGDYFFLASDDSAFRLAIGFGGNTLASAPTPSGPFNIVTAIDSHPHDAVRYYTPHLLFNGGALPNGVTTADLRLHFQNNAGTVLGDDSLPTLVPLLSLFPDAAYLSFYGANELGDSVEFQAQITSLTAVPEPAAWTAIAGSLLAAFALARRRHPRPRAS